ncbi:iron-containing alcohol dehydrogenase [Burkholderia sp. R-69608]|uniref:iron-containing alcohol dehydrogenase n=1 Tax=Paraburkholderia nemoris TaxID=2793076 RepID=UPI0019114A8B|nr:iron-containing alcohol dehydrogenase [Burkholderia sp. R-69608]
MDVIARSDGRKPWNRSRAFWSVPHGHCTCVTLPEVMRSNKPVTDEKQKLISEALDDCNRAAPDLVADLIESVEMPNQFHKVGVSRDQFELISRNATLDRWVHSWGTRRRYAHPRSNRLTSQCA